MNYRRWLIAGYLLALMGFTTSVLLIPGEKYNVLTTSDSGWYFGIAREMDQTNGLLDRYSLSHAPYGWPTAVSDQGHPLLFLMLYRGIHAIDPNVGLMDLARYWSPILFAISLIPIFLIGKELGGDLAGCAAAFFASVLTGSIYWCKVGAFDREAVQLIIAAWTIYLTIRVFKNPEKSFPIAILAGLVYSLFGLSWGGWLYLAPVIFGGLLLVLLLGFVGRLVRRSADLVGSFVSTIRENLHLIVGVLSIFLVATLVIWAMEGVLTDWIGFANSLLGYLGIGGGAGGGISFPRYAGEMAAPTSWNETISRFYTNDVLTKIVLFFIAIAFAKIVWSRKRWEMLTFPWLIILMGLVWPEKGQVRFDRMWWPFVAVMAGAGVGVLVSIFKRLSSESTTAQWIAPVMKPLTLAFCIGLFSIPFVSNAYAHSQQVTPPTEWHGFRGIDEALMQTFEWLKENSPENSVVAIQWSFGHLLTGASGRASVCDGVEGAGKEGEWEKDPSVVVRPPDYIYYVRNNTAYMYGVNVPEKRYSVNGRRVDVQNFPEMDEKELAWILGTYRDNYNVKIDYIIFEAQGYYRGIEEQKWGPAKILLGSEVKARLRTLPTYEGQNVILNFGENRETVVLDTQARNVFLRRTGEPNRNMDGYAELTLNAQGSLSDFLGFNQPPHTPDIPETVLIFRDENKNIVGGLLVESKTAEINDLGTPMGIRVFIGDDGNISYLRVVYTSSNGLVKLYKVYHEPSLTSPANGATINDSTPTLGWLGVAGAMSYEVVVDDDQDLSSPEITETVTGTSFTPGVALADGNYWWQVRAIKQDGTLIARSSTGAFAIDTIPPGKPELNAPSNGTTISDYTPTLEWRGGAEAVKHRLLVDTDADFSSPEINVLLDSPQNTFVALTLQDGLYSWKVIAIDGAGNETESGIWTFRRQATGAP